MRLLFEILSDIYTCIDFFFLKKEWWGFSKKGGKGSREKKSRETLLTAILVPPLGVERDYRGPTEIGFHASDVPLFSLVLGSSMSTVEIVAH